MKSTPNNPPAKSIDEYLAALPAQEKAALEKIRSLVKSLIPRAVEKISYRIPTFHYLSPLVGFAAFKDHCSFYVMSYKIMEKFEKELKPYKISTGTIRFPANEPLPELLLRKIIQARIKENEIKVIKEKKRARANKEFRK